MADSGGSHWFGWLGRLFVRGGPVVPVVRPHGVIAADEDRAIWARFGL